MSEAQTFAPVRTDDATADRERPAPAAPPVPVVGGDHEGFNSEQTFFYQPTCRDGSADCLKSLDILFRSGFRSKHDLHLTRILCKGKRCVSGPFCRDLHALRLHFTSMSSGKDLDDFSLLHVLDSRGVDGDLQLEPFCRLFLPTLCLGVHKELLPVWNNDMVFLHRSDQCDAQGPGSGIPAEETEGRRG